MLNWLSEEFQDSNLGTRMTPSPGLICRIQLCHPFLHFIQLLRKRIFLNLCSNARNEDVDSLGRLYANGMLGLQLDAQNEAERQGNAF